MCPGTSGATWTRHVLRLPWRRDLVYHAATAIPLLHDTAPASQRLHPSRPGTRPGPDGRRLRWGPGRVAPGYWESLHSPAPDDRAALHYPVADHGPWALELSGR